MEIEKLKMLCKNGMYYCNIRKSFCNEIDPITFFSTDAAKNTFGYYCDKSGQWVVFMTDSEQGVEIARILYDSESQAIQNLLEIVESQNFRYFADQITEHIDKKISCVKTYLEQNCNYNSKNADKLINYLKREPRILFEFVYFVLNGHFVPKKHAVEYQGFTAEMIELNTGVSSPEAFACLVWIKENPEKASKILMSQRIRYR